MGLLCKKNSDRLKTVFALGDNNQRTGVLLIELGQDHCCYAFLDKENKSISFLKYIGFEDHESEEKLAGILNELDQPVYQVVISSSYPQALLVPANHTSDAVSLLEPVYDLPLQKQLNDSIHERQMTAVYSLPVKIYEQLLTKFPSARIFHTYTTALKIFNGFIAENQVDVHISTQQFRVLVKKGNQIQLAQTYTYRSPLDVVYFLLKICYELGLDQSSVFVVLSGLWNRIRLCTRSSIVILRTCILLRLRPILSRKPICRSTILLHSIILLHAHHKRQPGRTKDQSTS